MHCHLIFSCSLSFFPITNNVQTPLYISSDLSYKHATEGPSDVQNILFLFQTRSCVKPNRSNAYNGMLEISSDLKITSLLLY